MFWGSLEGFLGFVIDRPSTKDFAYQDAGLKNYPLSCKRPTLPSDTILKIYDGSDELYSKLLSLSSFGGQGKEFELGVLVEEWKPWSGSTRCALSQPL